MRKALHVCVKINNSTLAVVQKFTEQEIQWVVHSGKSNDEIAFYYCSITFDQRLTMALFPKRSDWGKAMLIKINEETFELDKERQLPLSADFGALTSDLRPGELLPHFLRKGYVT